jgi:hypothetical protein
MKDLREAAASIGNDEMAADEVDYTLLDTGSRCSAVL